MLERRHMLEVVAFTSGAVLIVLMFIAGVVGLALWYERVSITCPDGQVYVTTDTIKGCMPWEETNE